MTDLLPFIVSGLVAGSLYGLAGLGLVLTFRTSGIFNFGHGAIAAAGAFVFYWMWQDVGLPWPLAAVATVVAFGVLGGALLELATRPLAGAPDSTVVVATVGLFIGVQGLLFLRFGDGTRTADPFLPTTGFTFQGVTISWGQVITVAVALAGALAMYLFLERHPLGRAMRAVVDNPRLLTLSGTAPTRVRRWSWVIGAAAAAGSGILLAPALNLDASLLTLIVIQALGACAIGLFRNLPATFVGGLVVGVVASLATKQFPEAPFSGLPPSVPFLILLAVLIVAAKKLPVQPAQRRQIAPSGKLHLPVAAVAGLVVIAVPFFADTKLPLWTNGLCYVVVFGSLSLLAMSSGQISLCHAAFLAIGASSMSHFTDAGLPWGIALVLAGMAVVPVGLLVAIPAIRLSGVYLALATLGLGIFLQNFVYPSFLMFGSELQARVDRPMLGPLDGTDDRTMYWITLAVVVVCMAAMLGLQRGRFGRFLNALAESPTMLATHGLQTQLTRLVVFASSAFFAGVGGALAVTQTGASGALTYGPVQSLLLVAVVGITGPRRLLGPVIAASLLGLVPGYVSSIGINEQLFGFGIIALIASAIYASGDQLRSRLAKGAAASDFRKASGPLRLHGEEQPA